MELRDISAMHSSLCFAQSTSTAPPESLHTSTSLPVQICTDKIRHLTRLWWLGNAELVQSDLNRRKCWCGGREASPSCM